MASDTQHLGEFLLDRPVAHGGMGEIWLATHAETGAPVAIKRMRPESGERLTEDLRARLLREIQAFALLDHENIVRSLGSGLDDEGCPYLALEWLEGENLAERQKRQPLRPTEILEVGRQTLNGLAACHQRGVVHRDIKPANLFLVPAGDGFTVKVLDFGLALQEQVSTRLTRAGAVLGTLFYLSPEQARGLPQIDGRTDLYALGVVLYELVTGRLPFFSEAAAAVLLKIVAERPPRPRQIRPDIPTWLETLILRAMEREVANRYADAGEMLEALEAGAALGLDLLPTDETALAVPSSSLEYRLVSLLSVALDRAADGLTSQIERTITEADGMVYRLLGDQVIGLFGLDRSVGDEARRAVQAGLAIRELAGSAVRLLAATVHLEVGVGLQLDASELDRSTGQVERCPPGELVVDRATREQLAGQLETEHVGIHVVARELRRPEGRRVLGVEIPLVGRETELAAVRAAFRRAEEHSEPELVLIQGPPGIGKSRLCLEVQRELQPRSHLLLEGRASVVQTRTPYSLLAQCLSRAAGVHVGQALDDQRQALQAFLGRSAAALGDETLLFVGEAIGVPFGETAVLQVARAEPQVMRERVTAAFESLFRAAGEHGPVAIHLDDIHWADEESLHLLVELADRLEGTPLFVLLAARPELDAEHLDRLRAVDATRIELEPLGRRPLKRLLQGMLGPKIPAELLQLIGSWSDGNPYFAEELVTWLVSRRALVGDPAEGWQLKVAPSTLQLPAGIEATVQARLDLLETGPKELLKAASVLGEVFWEDACLAMGIDDDVRGLLRQLEAEHFVVSRPVSRVAGTREWMFRHALLHQVAGQMLPRDRRRQLHLLAGKWLEGVGETDAAVLAHHFERGGDNTRAASYNAKAGEKSLADGDLERAVDCYLAAISLPEDLSEADHLSRAMGLARAYILLGRYNQAGIAMDPLTPADEAQRAEVLLLRGRIHLAKGQYEQAEQVLGQAIDALGPQRSFEARRALFATVWAQGRYGEAGGIAEEMYREACAGDQAIELCSAKLALAYYHAVGGDLSASVRLAREAVEHAREIGHPFREVDCLTLLASAQELVGLYDASFASLEAAGALAQRLKTSYTLAAVEACRGRVCLLRGQLAAAREHYRNATITAERLGDYRTLIAALAGEARALALPGEQQDLDRARTAAAQALEMATHHSPPSEAEAMLALAEVCLAADQLEEGVRHAEAALAVLDRLGTQERYEIEILLAAHAALSRAGRTDQAAAVLERAAQTLAAREQRITDVELRRSFVEQVPHNRRVRELAVA